MLEPSKVRPGDAIKASEWNKMIDATRSTPPSVRGGGKIKMQPVRLQTWWTRADGEWKATARPIRSLQPLTLGDPVDVFAPSASSEPVGTPGETRFFVIKRKGRWEKFETDQEVRKYRAGTGITFDDDVIKNAGVLNASIDGYYVKYSSGYLKFDPAYFTRLRDESLDVIPSEYLISLKSSLFAPPTITATASGNTLTIEIQS